MSLVSWFKSASTAKKIGAVALATINTLTLVNSVAVGHKIANLELGSGRGYSPAADILMAPVINGGVWILSKEASGSSVGSTPISLIANQTKDVMPKAADTALGVTVAGLGAPGAWVGHTVGTVTGFSNKIYSALKHNNP